MGTSIKLDIDEHFRVLNKESSHREYKQNYDPNNLSQYCKTLVSFANRDGGAIYFGIKNSPHDVIGISESPDLLSFTFPQR